MTPKPAAPPIGPLPSAEPAAVWFPVAALIPWDRNPRFNEQTVDALVDSIKRYGFGAPLLVRKANNVLIAGDTRLKAAKRLGLEMVPVRFLDLTEAQAHQLALADNKLCEMSLWDDAKLGVILRDLRLAEPDLALPGFDVKSFERLLNVPAPGESTAVDPDDVPDPMDEPTTKPGDLWILGAHRLLCGDSSKPADVDRLLGGAPIHLVNTDPPYNVKVEPRSNNAIAAGLSSLKHDGEKVAGAQAAMHHQGLDLARHPEKSKKTTKQLRAKDRPLDNDFMSDADFDVCLDAWFGNAARALIPGGGFYIWGGYANCANYPPFLKKHELYFSQAIIWVKEHPVLTRKDFMCNHEWCFYGWKKGAAHRWFGPNNATDVWSIKKVNPQSMVHLTEKPVELATRAMGYSSQPGENVLDLFGGSGSTLIGAETNARHAFLMDLDPAYCDVIVQRYEKFTGKKAEREASEDAWG